jgi:Domain of unknown function (DUF4407)
MNKVEKLLACDLAGGDAELLAKPSMTQDKNKYVSIGTTVVFTGLLAAGSGGYAFYTVFKVVELSVGLGALWGAMILNIDRLMILGMATEITPEIDPEAEKKSLPPAIAKLLKAIPRAILAVGIGIVVSTPVAIQIFQKEIAQQINLENKEELQKLEAGNNKNFASELNRRQTAVNTLNTQIQQAQTDAKTAEKVLQMEIDGLSGSGLKGKGSSYAEKLDSVNKRRGEVNALQTELNEANQLLNETLQSKKTQFNLDKQILEDNSLGRQLSALHHLGAKDPTIRQTESGLHLLFILIETMPLMMKLMSGESAHDKITAKKNLGVIDIENQETQQNKNRSIELANIRSSWSSTIIQQTKQNILKLQERAYRCRQQAIELDNLNESDKQFKYADRLELKAQSLADELQTKTLPVKPVQHSQGQCSPSATSTNS